MRGRVEGFGMSAATILTGDPLCYLATPYSRYKDGNLPLAFQDASKLAALLMQAGVKVYSPIAHTHPLAVYGNIDPLDHAIWLPFDEAMMKACQALLVAHMDGWEESKGIAYEITFFTNARKPIFDLDPSTLTMVKRQLEKPPRKRHESMTLDELQEERGYWDTCIREANGWGASLAAANEFRASCDFWIKRRQAESQVTEGSVASPTSQMKF
jgi:nucleoside 2-deoxyribosyltransferase